MRVCSIPCAWVWAAALILYSPVTEGSDLVQLARAGRSEYQVVIAADAKEPIPTAAKDFVQFFEEITGAEVGIVTDDEAMGEREIIIGPSKHLDNLAITIDWEKLGRDGYVIRTVRGQLVLFGGSGQGTANAVYAFLEERLGCRWYTPSVSVIPKRAELTIDLIHEERVPPLEARGLSCANSADPAWAARNRINCFNPSLRWASPGEEGHNPAHIEKLYADARLSGAMKFAWPGSFGSGYWLHTLGKGNHFLSKELFKEHPEYFGMNAEGERDVEITPCLSHPDVFGIVLENAGKWLARTPGARVISISQSDKPPRDYCRCERCQEVWKKYTYTLNRNPLGRLPDATLPGWTKPGLIRPVWDPNSTAGTTVGPTGILLEFVNRVAEGLEEEYPEVLVHTLAYYWTKYPPDNVSLHRSVVVDFAPLNSCYYHPLSACRFNEEFKGLWTMVRRWRKLTPHVWVWRYDHAGGPDRMLPRPTLRYLDLTMRELAQADVSGVYFFTYEFRPWMWMNDLRSWLFAKLLWDPEYDIGEGMEEFIRAYYGEAGDAVLAYVLDTQERESYGDTVDGQIKRMFPGTFHVGGGGIPIAASAISRWDKLLDDAEAAVADDLEHLERVKVARLSVQRAALEFLPAAHPVRKKAYVEFFPAMATLGMSEAGLEQMREKYDPAKKKEGAD